MTTQQINSRMDQINMLVADSASGSQVSARSCEQLFNLSMGLQNMVARFHLGNGARLEQINWLGNTAERGIDESYGLMVNYLYVPETIEANHEAFAHDGVVVRSANIDDLMGDRPH